MLSIPKLQAKTWQETPQACKYELDLLGVIRPAVPRQIPFHLLGRSRNHRSHSWPLLATQRAWNLILTDEDIPWCWVQQLQAPTSHSTLLKAFREKEEFGKKNRAEEWFHEWTRSHCSSQDSLSLQNIAFWTRESFQYERSGAMMPASFEIISERTTRSREANNIFF